MPPYSLFRRFLSLMLAVLVLTASVGLTVQRQICRMSGRSRVEVSLPGRVALRSCEGALASTTSFAKDDCCDFSSHLHKLSAPVHELAAKVPVPAPALAFWAPIAVWLGAASVEERAVSGPRWMAADSSPPPRGGRKLLAFVCSLVV